MSKPLLSRELFWLNPWSRRFSRGWSSLRSPDSRPSSEVPSSSPASSSCCAATSRNLGRLPPNRWPRELRRGSFPRDDVCSLAVSKSVYFGVVLEFLYKAPVGGSQEL